MSEFEPAVDYVLRNEGGFVNDPKDPGGATNFGISLKLLRSLTVDDLKKVGIHHYPDSESVKLLTLAQAVKIYHGEFWEQEPVYRIESQDFANYFFDSMVNMGPFSACICTSRAIRAANSGILPEFGRLTDKMIDAINNEPKSILAAFRSERAAHYRMLAQKNASLTRFINGWLNRAYRHN